MTIRQCAGLELTHRLPNSMRIKPLPSAEELLRDFSYNSSTGELSRASGARIGVVFKRRYGQRYVYANVRGQHYLAHRLIWKIVHGTDPFIIDHIDGDTSNNRINNLRSVGERENAKNVRRQGDAGSGVVGVYFSKASRKWRAQIKIDRKQIALGSFASLGDAVAARLEAETRYNFFSK